MKIPCFTGFGNMGTVSSFCFTNENLPRSIVPFVNMSKIQSESVDASFRLVPIDDHHL